MDTIIKPYLKLLLGLVFVAALILATKMGFTEKLLRIELSGYSHSQGETVADQGSVSGSSQSDAASIPKGIFSVSSGKSSVSIDNSSGEFSPSSGDFLITFWFKPSRLPEVGERFQLIDCFTASKTVGNHTRPGFGYAVALSSERDGIRPMVYWYGDNRIDGVGRGHSDPGVDNQAADKKGSVGGRWYSFSQLPIHAHEWFQLAVLWHSKDQVLELRGFSSIATDGIPRGDVGKSGTGNREVIRPLESDNGWYRAGAYKLSNSKFPPNTAPFSFGAVGDQRFRGLIGALRVVGGSIAEQSGHDLLMATSHGPNERLLLGEGVGNESNRKKSGKLEGEQYKIILELLPYDTRGSELSALNNPSLSVMGLGKRFQFFNTAEIERKIELFGGKLRGAAQKTLRSERGG